VVGVITSFVSNVNRLLSFRMSDLVVKYLGESLERKEYERAAAVVKFAGLVETSTSIVAYLILVFLAPWGARVFGLDPSTTPLIILFGITILGSITAETSTGILRVGNHYKSQAVINLVQSAVTAVMILAAYFSHAGVLAVLLAYMTGKMILGLTPVVLTIYWLPQMLGKSWWRTSFSALPPLKELVRFALSTNLSGTVNMLARDSEVLWVSYFFSPLQAGYYKTALAIINLVVMPITPFVGTTYPEITRAIASYQWARLRSLLRRVTLLTAAWTGAVGVGLLLFGQRVLFFPWTIFGHAFSIYRSEFLPAYPILLILLVGFGVTNILYWNRSLLLALGYPDYPLKVVFYAMLAKVALAFWLVPRLGYLMEAGLLSAYFIFTVGLIVWRGLGHVHLAEQGAAE
jgi:O-antigen/teichoic acid export membrane protein